MADDALLDWELLHDSDTDSIDSITSEKKSGSSSVIDDRAIVSDHFSVDNLMVNPTELSQFGVIESGDSSRVDYGSEHPNSGEVLVDIGFDQLNVNQLSDASVVNELGIYDSKSGILGDDELRVSDPEPKREAVTELTDANQCFPDLGVSEERHVESQSVVEESTEDPSKSCSDSGVNEVVSGDYGIVNDEEEIVSDGGVVSTEPVDGDGRNIVAANSGDEGRRKETVWWKMPFVLLKYCTYRIGPVWFVSLSAAVMGLVLLGRRLHNKKKKAQRFHLNVRIDDKNASRSMSQAARLNEVFTEVRRVLVIRPAPPSPGAWPVLSLR